MTDSVHKCWMPQREVARIEKPDIRSDEHGGLMFGGGLKYNGGGQGFGHRIDIDFVQKFMEVFGYPTYLKDTDGLACWVTHCQSNIHMIEPLLPNEGKAFDIDQWSIEAGARANLLREMKLDDYSLRKIEREFPLAPPSQESHHE